MSASGAFESLVQLLGVSDSDAFECPSLFRVSASGAFE